MKFTAIAFVLIFAGICALPQAEIEAVHYAPTDEGEARITVTNRIQKAVDEMNNAIVEKGYDPWVVPYSSAGVDTPVGWAYAHVEGLECTGSAHNRFDRLSFNALTLRLNFNLMWPRIACTIKSQGIEAAVLNHQFQTSHSGLLEMIDTRVEGSMRFATGIISGFRMTDCELLVSSSIKSNMRVQWQGRDVSHKVNGVFEALDKQLRDKVEEISSAACELVAQAM